MHQVLSHVGSAGGCHLCSDHQQGWLQSRRANPGRGDTGFSVSLEELLHRLWSPANGNALEKEIFIRFICWLPLNIFYTTIVQRSMKLLNILELSEHPAVYFQRPKVGSRHHQVRTCQNASHTENLCRAGLPAVNSGSLGWGKGTNSFISTTSFSIKCIFLMECEIRRRVNTR